MVHYLKKKQQHFFSPFHPCKRVNRNQTIVTNSFDREKKTVKKKIVRSNQLHRAAMLKLHDKEFMIDTACDLWCLKINNISLKSKQW